MQKIISALIFLLPALSFAQKAGVDTNYIFWSKDRPLQESDFQIRTGHVSNMYSFAQFGFDYKVGGTFGLPKDYKNKIRNYFIRTASWLDTTYEVNTSIKYQQTLFDLAEVYVRQFRKAVYENRKKLPWGKVKIEELNAQILTDFSKRRVLYDTTTSFGTLADKQKEWEILIAKELDELQDFAAG